MDSVENKNIAHRNGKTSPVRVAVTGNAGSGKTTVCHRLQELGLPLIVLDELARQAVAPGSPALKRLSVRFGARILNREGSLDRAVLRRLMVRDPAVRRDLEEILHPEIIFLMNHRIQEAAKKGATIVVVEVPLLFECGLEPLFDRIVLVTADRDRQLSRLAARDGLAPAEASALVGIQMPDELKRKRSDFIIENNASPSELIKSVDRFYQMIYETRK